MDFYCSGIAKIGDRKTGDTFEIASEDLFCESDADGERKMGPETRHQATMDHEILGQLTWEIVEYPSGSIELKESPKGNFDIVQDIEFGLRHSQK